MGIRFQALDKQGRDLVLRVLEEQVKSGGEPFEVEKIPADGDAVAPPPEPSPAATRAQAAQAADEPPDELALDETVVEVVPAGDLGAKASPAPSSMDQVNLKSMVHDDTTSSFSAPWGHELPQIPTEVLEASDPVTTLPDAEEDLAEARLEGMSGLDVFDEELAEEAAEPEPFAAGETTLEPAEDLEGEEEPDFEIPPLADVPDFAVPAATGPDDFDSEAPTLLSERVRIPPASPEPSRTAPPEPFAFEPPLVQGAAAEPFADEPFADEPLPEPSAFDDPLPDLAFVDEPLPDDAGDDFELPDAPLPGGAFAAEFPDVLPPEDSFAAVLPDEPAPGWAPQVAFEPPAAPPAVGYPSSFDFEPQEAPALAPVIAKSPYAELLDEWDEPSETRVQLFLSDLRMAVFESKGRLIAVALVIVAAIAAYVWREPLVTLAVGRPVAEASSQVPAGVARTPPPPAAIESPEPTEPGPEIVRVLPPDTEVAEPAPPPAPVSPEPRLPPPATVPPRSLPPPSNAPPASRVLLVTFDAGAGSTRVVIRFDGAMSDSRWSHEPADYDPRKEWIELRGIVEPYASGQIRVATPQLERIRTGLQDGGVLRVVFDFASPSVTLTEIDNRGDRLEITVGPR